MLRPIAVRLLLAGIVAIGFSLPADATVRSEGAKIRWVGELPTAAQAGQDFQGRFEVVAARPGLLEDVRVEGSGWSVHWLASGRTVMASGQRRGFTFTARPIDPSEPLIVTAKFDGQEIRGTMRLDAVSLAGVTGHRRLLFASGPPRVGSPPRDRSAAPNRAQTTAFHFTGRITYVRGGGPALELGADHITVKIWDEDPVSDELIWQGETDLNGNFEAFVDWDDCDVSGCDDPDIYVEVITLNPTCIVKTADIFEVPYSWESAVMDNFTGNTIDFGTMKPETDQYGAFHVYTSIIRANRFGALFSMAPPQIQCRWPNDDGTYYNRDQEEMSVGSDDTWNEGAPAHEYGHHLHYIYGNLPESNYENGFCDTPTPSHCVWCPENDQDAFKEGWADWFGSVVLRGYQSTYNVIPTAIGDFRFTLDTTDVCQQDNQHWPGSNTEGYIGAVLRDIEDAQNEDQDGGAADCDMDVMTMGAGPIMTVFKDDDPTDIGQFLSHFRTRYGNQVDQDLWSTLRNVWPGFAFTLPPPVLSSQPQGCLIRYPLDPVTLSVNANGSLLKYQWRRNGVPLGNGAGVSGATSKNLALVLGSNSGGAYDCVVTTCDGSLNVTSQASRITMMELRNATDLVSWGLNNTYQVGDGTNTTHVPPYKHTAIGNVLEVEGGSFFTIALRSDGQVFTWGENGKGQLGIGSTTPSVRTSPGTSTMTGAVHVAAGQQFAMAITASGALSGWGDNFRGQIGDGTTTQREAPVPINIGGCVIGVSCGFTHTIALRSDGVVYSWGLNTSSALGRGSANQTYSTPDVIPGLTNVVAISASGYTNLALKSDGTVWAWGNNQFGQLGIGSTATDVMTPTRINGLPAIRSIAAGNWSCFAVGTDGSCWSWGWDNNQGMLGTGAPLVSRNVPGTMLLSNPKQIVVGETGWAAALMGDRTVKVWGNNNDWINGTTGPLWIFTPTQVPGIVRASAIGAGHATLHACGFKEDATTGIPDGDAPLDLALAVSPNPSLSMTRMSFDLPRESNVTLAVYDLAGRRVHTVVDGSRAAGRYQEAWDGRGDGGRAMAGVFFVRLDAGGETRTQRLVRIR